MTDPFATDDLTAPEVNADPYWYFGRLREIDPVHWNPLAQAWIVTRYSDVVRVTRNHELFSSAVSAKDPRDPYPPINDTDRERYEIVIRLTSDVFLQHDPPEHLKMRQTVHRWFTPKAVERWRAEARSVVRDLVERQRLRGKMDLKVDVATPLPVMVICRMLGVPQSDADMLRKLADRINETTRSAADRTGSVVAAFQEFGDYITPLIEAFPRLHLQSETLDYVPGIQIRQLQSMPVYWD